MDRSIISCLVMSIVLLGVDCIVQLNSKFTKVKKLVLHLLLWGSIMSPIAYLFMMVTYYHKMQVLSIIVGCCGIIFSIFLIISSFVVKRHYRKKFHYRQLTELLIIAAKLYLLIDEESDKGNTKNELLLARVDSIENYLTIVKNLTGKYMISCENFRVDEAEQIKKQINVLYNQLKSKGIELKGDQVINMEKIFELY